MKELAVFWARMMRCNCNVRINTILVTAVPLAEQLGNVWPTFHDYLPANLYGMGFVALGIANVLLHARTASQQEKNRAEPPVIGN